MFILCIVVNLFSFVSAMSALASFSTDQLLDFLKIRSIPQEALDLLRENGIDGSTLNLMKDDIDEFMAVIPKSGLRLLIKRVLKEEQGKQAALFQVLPAGMDIDLVTEHPSLGMFSTANEGSMVGLLASPLSPSPLSPSALSPSPLSPSPLSPSPPPVPVQASMPNGAGQELHQASLSSSPPSSLEPRVLFQSRKSGTSCSIPVKRLPEALPFPEKFSIRVQDAITADNVLSVRRQLISDIGSFFFGLTKHPLQGDYKRMALATCERFPELRDVSPSSYWVSVQKQLSQFFRNQRRMSKPQDSSVREDNAKAAKKAKLLPSTGDDKLAQTRNLELLRLNQEEDMSSKTYSSLIAETFIKRRQFITEEAKSSKEVLDMCPYLGKPKHVRDELSRIIGHENVGRAECRLEEALKVVLGQEYHRTENLSNIDVVEAASLILQKTKRKGSSQSLFKFQDSSTQPEKLFTDKRIEFRLVCIGTSNDVEQVFVAGEDQAFLECANCKLVNAMIDLIASYYVFDVQYPDCLAGILYFLQDVALLHVDSSYRGTKYSTFMAEFRRDVERKCKQH